MPQKAVVSPLLFVTFLDNLFDMFEDDTDTTVSAYTDNVAVAVSGSRKGDLEKSS